MTMPSLAGQRFLILGLGTTGLALVRFLRDQDAEVAVADTRAAPPGLAALREAFGDVPVHLGPFSALPFDANQTLLVSPGLAPEALPWPAIKAAGCPVLGELDLFFRFAKAPVLGITGTNGKSTVTALLGHVLKAAGFRVAVGGNLGPAAVSLLSSNAPDVFVLELSSFQLDWAEPMPLRQALFLNLSSDHLDRYGDLERYRASKARIYQRAERVLFNWRDPATHPAPASATPALAVGLAPGGGDQPFCIEEDALCGPEGWRWPLARVPLVGSHNLENVLFALTAAWDFGASLGALGPALETFQGLPHRCTVAGEVGGVRYLNDSKATNVGAAVAALAGLGPLEHVLLLAGGLAKGADLSPLRAAARGLKQALLFGTDAPQLAELLAPVCSVQRVASLDVAVAEAALRAVPGDTVLLAPACASFDQFRSFEHRGAVFEAAVAALAARAEVQA